MIFKQVNKLIEYLSNAPHNNYIINNIFSDKKSLEIFIDHFITPKKIYHYEISKDITDKNIQNQIIDENDQKRLYR